MNPPIMAAAANADWDVVTELLNAGADVNARDDRGWTALMEAARQGRDIQMAELLEAGADVNAVAGPGGLQAPGEQERTTALIEAAKEKHAAVVLLLLNAGADRNHRDATGKTAADWAQAGGAAQVLKLLTEPSETPSADIKELSLAAERGDLDEVRRMIAAGVDVNAEDIDAYGKGEGPLHRAARRGHLDVIKALLEAKADVNADGFNGITALMNACSRGHDQIVRLLLNAGAGVALAMTGPLNRGPGISARPLFWVQPTSIPASRTAQTLIPCFTTIPLASRE